MGLIPAQEIPSVAPAGAPGVYQQVRTNGAQFGENVAIAGREMGRTLEQAAEAAARNAIEFQKQENVNNVNDVYATKFSPAFRDEYQRYYSLQGREALTQLPDFMKRMQELRETTRDALPNDPQKRAFDDMSRRRVEYEFDAMARHAEQQNKAWGAEVFGSSLKTHRVDAADKYNDEQAFGRSLGAAAADIEQYALSTGKSAEWIRAESAKFVSEASIDRLGRWMAEDPLKAQAWYTANSQLIDPAHRATIEQHLKSAVFPIQAKSLADATMAEAAGPGGSRDLRASLGDVIAKAQDKADALHPNDPVFRDLVVQQVKGRVATIVQAQEAVERQAQGALIDKAIKENPATMDALLSSPNARSYWLALDPQAKLGIISLVNRNATGDRISTNPQVMLDAFQRIHLDENDPRKLRSVTELAGLVGSGINFSDYERLSRELERSRTPEGNAFLKDVQSARRTAHAMLARSPIGEAMPNVAEEASYRFSQDLDRKIEQFRVEKKDPRALLTPGGADYALAPERVQTFMPAQALSDAAKRAGAPSAQPVRVKDDAEFNALPKGAVYVGPDGVPRRKP